MAILIRQPCGERNLHGQIISHSRHLIPEGLLIIMTTKIDPGIIEIRADIATYMLLYIATKISKI